MRSQKQAKQSAAESALATEGPDPAATAQAQAVGPTGSPMATRARPEPDRGAPPRLHSPDRQQLLSPMTIDELLEADHPARAVWSYVEGLDLTPLYDRIRARGSVAGRPAIDPRLLVALWLYATLSGFSQRSRTRRFVHPSRCLPLARRWRLRQLPHARRFPHRPP